MEMQWWCTLISWLRIGIIVRSNPYFGSSNSNYVMHDGAQLSSVLKGVWRTGMLSARSWEGN